MLQEHAISTSAWNPALNINIERWLSDRQQLLVEYCNLSHKTLDDDSKVDCAEKLRHLCQTLIDYVSVGHFGIYDKILSESKQQAESVLSQTLQHFSLVDETTDKVLDFNDKYLETDDLSVLIDDLSALGEILESRFSAEDSMMSVLHYHRPDARLLN